jgi:Tfp pilus assembly major pilin PilA
VLTLNPREKEMNTHSQKGLTTIGWLVVIAIFGSIVLTGFKILPMYLEYFNVKAAMEAVAKSDKVDLTSKQDIWRVLNANLKINSVRSLKQEDFKFTREDGATVITADYEVRRPYFLELYIGAHFTHSIEIRR